MEGGKGVEEKKATNEVVLQISSLNSQNGSPQRGFSGSNVELTELQSPPLSTVAAGSASPEITKQSPTSNKPRNIPGEVNLAEENTQLKPIANPSPSTKVTPAGGEDDDDEEVYKIAYNKVREMYGKKFNKLVLIEYLAFLGTVGFLIASLTVHKLEHKIFWGLGLWKWCVLGLVVMCGRLVTEWFINVLVFLIERNFLLKKKVLYFVYGLKMSVQVFFWLALILIAWALLFDHGVKRSRRTSRILHYITRGLASCLIGAAIWLVKNLLVKLLASSFQCKRFFDRIQDAIFKQYVLRTLLMDEAGNDACNGKLRFKILKKDKKKEKEGAKEEVVHVQKLKKLKQEQISAWTMKGLIDVVTGSGLSTISNTLESIDDEEGADITSDLEAKAVAYKIFQKVAKCANSKTGYIEEADLLNFMKKEDVDHVFSLFEGAAVSRKIEKTSLKQWLVKVYLERKSLVRSLNDTKTAIEELNRLASAVLLPVILIMWLLLMEFLTTNTLVFISSQLVLVAFVFGNTAKTVFEAIIFVFVTHPFDVGDRCVVDGVQMIVDEMNILTTIFLRYDNEMICYPNSLLASKPISNFYRSPPEMGDSVEFAVDVSTKIDAIVALKAGIKRYLESKPEHWKPGHSVLVNDIEDVNKMKMGLYLTHTINFQNYGDKNSRRSELVLELKKLFEELDITYQLLPQQVQLSYVGSPPLR